MLARDITDTALLDPAQENEDACPAAPSPLARAVRGQEAAYSKTSRHSNESRRRARLAILVNTIAPYRIPIYSALAERFDTVVLHGGKEANRQWELNLPPSLKCHSVPTLQFAVRKQTGVAGLWDKSFLHLNIGLLWWLPLVRPDAIFTNELGIRTMAALAYGRLARVPVWVGWEGSLHSERNIDTGRKRLRRFLIKRVENWVSFGSTSRDYLLSNGVCDQQIVKVQNCVEQEIYQRAPAPAPLPLPELPGFVLLSVGQLIPRKGLDKIVRACGRLAERGLNVTLVIVGNGPERDALRQEAADSGLENFFLLPNQSTEVLLGLYQRADAFVMPSLEDVWGLVVSEALWAGLPVLCSKYAGCAEALPQENLFDPLSEDNTDAALERVIRGELAPASTDLLMTWQQVSKLIGDAILRDLRSRNLAVRL